MRETTLRKVRTARGPRRADSENGVGMVATLAVVVILGVIVTIAISSGPSSPKTSGGSAAGTTTTTVKSIGTEANEAAVSSCLGNYAAVTAALATYRTLESSAPPAGTAWATSSANGGALLESWPTDAPYYVITWNGVTLNVTPRKGVASRGTPGTSTPPTGCYAA